MNEKHTFEYAEIEMNKEHKLFIFRWLASSFFLTSEMYQTEVLRLVHFYEQHSCSLVVINSRHMKFVITPTLQQWYLQTIVPVCYKNGVKKIATVLSDDLILQLVSEQVQDEAKITNAPFQNKLFRTESEAIYWLLH